MTDSATWMDDDMDDECEELETTLTDATEDELILELTKRSSNYIVINENSLEKRELIEEFLLTNIYPNLNDR